MPDDLDLTDADAVADWLHHSGAWPQHHQHSLYICPLCSAAIPSGFADEDEGQTHLDMHVTFHYLQIRAMSSVVRALDTHYHSPNVLA